MPVRVGRPDNWQVITPTAEWQTMKSTVPSNQLEAATNLYYVAVSRRLDP
jgi:hypothetical protein